jgi:hypothetical protein
MCDFPKKKIRATGKNIRRGATSEISQTRQCLVRFRQSFSVPAGRWNRLGGYRAYLARTPRRTVRKPHMPTTHLSLHYHISRNTEWNTMKTIIGNAPLVPPGRMENWVHPHPATS